MAPWIPLDSGHVIHEGDIVAVIDWTQGKASRANRELVSYARAHGFLIEEGNDPKSLVLTRDKVFLLRASTRSIRKKMDRT
ncbi:MAG TPA: DUF370 domain-containing protein [Firmicutes bacterium]|nr:DUF370 domain-containing protein [Candidatus Fermentithermobacillaceae bacterium]